MLKLTRAAPRRARSALLCALLSISASSIALAGEAETVIVTGTKATGGEFGAKSGIPLEEVSQGVQVLTSEDLEARGARSIGDALRAVPSASVGTPRTSAYQSFTLKVRGFLADQMRNGVRQRYYEDVDASALSNIERIEVLKGPSSVLFGQSAVGGIISIVTKQPEKSFGWGAHAALGSYDQRLAGFDVTGPIGEESRLFFRLNGEIERSGTYVDFQDIDRENASFSLTYAPSTILTAYLVSEWTERRTLRNPGLPIVGTVVSNGVSEIPRETFLSEPGIADLESFAPLVQAWVDVALGGGWTLTPRLSYSGFDTNFTQLRVRAVDADGVTVNRNGRFGLEDDEYTVAQIDLTGALTLAGIKHDLLVGVEFDRERATFYQENIAGVTSINALAPVYGSVPGRPYTFAFYSVGDIDAWSVYGQDLIALNDRWSLVLGLRGSTFDNVSEFNGARDTTEFDSLTYQVGSTYRLTKAWSLFGGYNTGFDIEGSAGGRSFDGTPFDPEESDQIEAGVRYAAGSLSGSASLFQIRRKNVLTDDPINAGFSIQTGEVRVQGFEIEGTWAPVTGLTLQGGYAYLGSEITKSNNGDEGDDLADAPEHQASLFLAYDVPNTALQVRGAVAYVGERLFSNADVEVFPGLLASEVTLDSYVTVDLGASYEFGFVRMDVALTNALDETYYTREFNDFSVFPGEPRQVSVRFSRAF